MVIEIDKRNKLSKQVVFSLGGNIGNVEQTLNLAINFINDRIGKVKLISSIYTTKAWGVENQSDFLNQVVSVESSLLPTEVLSLCLIIEKELGRNRINQKKWQERVIDIDILFYGEEIITLPELLIPHPYIGERNFVLYPLSDILPDFIHPVLKNTVQELKNSCQDKLLVVKI